MNNPASMDPADPGAITKALSAQGIIVGKHDSQIQEMVDTLRDLSNSMARMQTQLSLLTPGSAGSEGTPPGLSSSLAAGSTVSTPREPFVPTPESYAGDLGSCSRFLFQCSIVFVQQPSSYSSDNAKIGYVVNLLRGKASDWATALWQANSPVLQSFDSFIAEMKKVFDHPVQGQEAVKRLLDLRQGSQSVAAYSVDFSILAAASVYHDLAPVFSKAKATSLPPHRPYDCPIDLLPGASLPTSRLYNLSRPEREAMEKYISESLAAGLIRPPSSPLGAGFFFVEKKDKTLRQCIDFRGLNDITIKNKYPLPLIDPAFEPFHQATIFSKLDLRNAYHLVRIREGDEWKTAFNTPLGHFEYQVMPFGLTNAPAVFQAMINDVLRDMLNRFIFVYLDDILIFSRSLPEHTQHVRQVLQRLLENQLFVKAEKCEFHVSKVSFLGFIIAPGQLHPDPSKIKAVENWPTPSTRKKLQQFLGFANFYRRFIRNYSKVAAPLTCLTSTTKPFLWTPEAERAFTLLKSLFTSAPILSHPDPSLQFIVEVDASETVVLALQEWRHWLEGAEQPFLVWTDHKNLAYLRSAKRLNPRQARWALFLSRFEFTLTYRPGSHNTKPDALSRQFSLDTSPSEPASILPPSCIVGAASWDIETRVQEALKDHPAPNNCPKDRLFVPSNLRSLVLQWIHTSKFSLSPWHSSDPLPPPSATLLVAQDGSRHPGIHQCLLCLCPWQILSPCSSWVPQTPSYSSPPLVSYCCGLRLWSPTIPSPGGGHGCSLRPSPPPQMPRSLAARAVRAALVRSSTRSQKSANKLRRRTSGAGLSHRGQKVWLSSRDLPLQVPSRKLAPRYIGPYVVEKVINPSSVRPQAASFSTDPPYLPRLPSSSHSLLVSFARPPPSDSPPPPAQLIDGHPAYSVKEVFKWVEMVTVKAIAIFMLIKPSSDLVPHEWGHCHPGRDHCPSGPTEIFHHRIKLRPDTTANIAFQQRTQPPLFGRKPLFQTRSSDWPDPRYPTLSCTASNSQPPEPASSHATTISDWTVARLQRALKERNIPFHRTNCSLPQFPPGTTCSRNALPSATGLLAPPITSHPTGNFTLAIAIPPVHPLLAARPSPISPTLRQKILVGNYIDLALLIQPSAHTITSFGEPPTPQVAAQPKPPSHSRVLTPLEFAFSLYRDTICSVFPNRRAELDDYLSIILDLALRFGSTGFYTYRTLFASQATGRLQQFNQSMDWGSLDSELYCRMFAASSSLACNLCGAPSHPATKCIITAPLPRPLAPPAPTPSAFSRLGHTAPPPPIMPKPPTPSYQPICRHHPTAQSPKA
ncbi:hypothetical protein L3Q82_025538 [Scortum barcoo]|uniref:Uncharacterized protein n=1 Tax=Scortum barcoo TaxID=214431 RepID=A0ACB8WLC6_9TELE|nr:hypothetical protein L3Q82_025538 [Scortum barcoo]